MVNHIPIVKLAIQDSIQVRTAKVKLYAHARLKPIIQPIFIIRLTRAYLF